MSDRIRVQAQIGAPGATRSVTFNGHLPNDKWETFKNELEKLLKNYPELKIESTS